MRKTLLFCILLIALFAGCMKSSEPANTCDYDPCALKATASEVTAVESYLAANNIQATKHCSGMYYRIDLPGAGTTPTICSEVTVAYEGKLTNGYVFDKSDSTSFGLYGVINGWKNGLPLVKPGGRIYLYVPPSLGYGASPYQTIPANSILIFRVDLKSVK